MPFILSRALVTSSTRHWLISKRGFNIRAQQFRSILRGFRGFYMYSCPLCKHAFCLLQYLPTRVCLVRASWLLCTFSSSSCPAGSVCVSLKWSTSVGGFFQSTWIETSVWPRTRISSIAETSGRDTSVGQQGGTGSTDKTLELETLH